MQDLHLNSNAQDRFILKERESQTSVPLAKTFSIRPTSQEVRSQLIEQFDHETAQDLGIHAVMSATAKAQEARPGIATLLLNAEILIQAGERAAATHLLRQALNLDSRHPEAIKKMMRCLGDRDWELEQKIRLQRLLVEIEPTFQNYSALGCLCIDRGELDLALDAFFEANLRVQDEGEGLFDVFKHMGNIYVRKGDFESAEEFYHKAFTLNPDSDVLFVNLGTLSIQRSDWAEAQVQFRRAIDLNELNDKAWVGLALCHQQVGDSQLAMGTLANALDICPSNRTAVHLLASWSFNSGDQTGAAIERLQDYLATQEMDVEMSLVLVHLYCQQRQLDLALLELERALCWNPQREELVHLYAELSRGLPS